MTDDRDGDGAPGASQADWALAGIAIVSVIASTVHGWAHATIPVPGPAWRLSLVVLTLFVAPIVGLALLATGRSLAGAWTLLLSGVAGLTLEGLLHFVVVNSDNVATVEAGHALFANTAALTTAGDALLVLAAGWVLWHSSRGSSQRSSLTSNS